MRRGARPSNVARHKLFEAAAARLVVGARHKAWPICETSKRPAERSSNCARRGCRLDTAPASHSRRRAPCGRPASHGARRGACGEAFQVGVAIQIPVPTRLSETRPRPSLPPLSENLRDFAHVAPTHGLGSFGEGWSPALQSRRRARSFCLRVSGAVAPSAPDRTGLSRACPYERAQR